MDHHLFPQYKRGEIYYVDFGNQPGAVVCGMHPAMIVQNDLGNRYSSTIIVAAISTGISNTRQKTHIELGGRFGLHKHSVLLLEQLLTVDKAMIYQRLGKASPELLMTADYALISSLGLQPLMKVKKKRKHNQLPLPPS